MPDFPFVLMIYWTPGEALEVDQGELRDWEALALLDAAREFIESESEEEEVEP